MAVALDLSYCDRAIKAVGREKFGMGWGYWLSAADMWRASARVVCMGLLSGKANFTLSVAIPIGYTSHAPRMKVSNSNGLTMWSKCDRACSDLNSIYTLLLHRI